MPLKVIPFTGLTISAISFIAFIVYATRAIYFGVPFAGFGTLLSANLLLFGLLFLLLGLMSEYIGMIYEEVRGRPTFIIRQAHGLDPVVDGEQIALAQHLTAPRAPQPQSTNGAGNGPVSKGTPAAPSPEFWTPT